MFRFHSALLAACLAVPVMADVQSSAGIASTICTNFVETGLTGVAPQIFRHSDGSYRIYYMGKGLASAKSSDLQTFTAESGVRLASSVTIDGKTYSQTRNPWVISRQAGGFRMLFDAALSNGDSALLSATSSDGLTFSAEGVVIAGSSADIETASGKIFLSVPTGIRLPDGRWRMYFVARGTDIESALSSDEGKTWTRESGVRISNGVDPTILQKPAGGYRLVYTDWASSTRLKRLLVADSSDGLTFTPASTAFLSMAGSGSVVDPDVYQMPDGRYRMLLATAASGSASTLLYSCDLPAMFQIQTSASGGNSALSLTSILTPDAMDSGKTANLYLAARVGTQYYFHNGTSWQAWTSGSLPVYAQTFVRDALTLTPLSAANVSAYPDAALYLGYGLSEADMLSGNKYQLIHTVH